MLRRKKSKVEVVREAAADLTDRASDLTGRASELATKAGVVIAPKAAEARSVAGSAYEAASHKIRDEVAPKVRDEYAPAVAGALGKTRLADTRLAQTKLVEPPKKGGKLKKLLVLLGLGGAAFVVSKRLGGSSSTPVPTPPPAPHPTGSHATTPSTATDPVPDPVEGDPAASTTSAPDGTTTVSGDKTD